MHCGDQRHLGLCLGYDPALAYGSCRVSDQGTTLRASDLHNARAAILNPFRIGTNPSISLQYQCQRARRNCFWMPMRRQVLTVLQMVCINYSTTICKLVDLISALHQSDWRIPNWVSAKTVHSSSTNHGQTTARFRSFFR